MSDQRRALIRFVPLLSILLAFAFLALVYAGATPPLEASDELWHVGMAQHIAETGTLPVQVVGVDTIYEQEGSQPPLYYLIAAALISPFDRSDFDSLRQPNPHAIAGVPGAVGNKNLVLHQFPLPPTGTALAIMLVRLLSIGLGIVTVSAVYLTARTLAVGQQMPVSPTVIATLAAGLVAFNPMFLFISASVNNDNLVTALNSLVIWQMALLLRDGFSPRRSLMIAVWIALASLSKLSGLVLVPVVALAALWVAYRRRDWRGLIFLGALMAGVWALLAGWWYVRNITLYGELFGTSTMALVAGAREAPFTLQALFDEFQGFRFAYWALFGAVNIMTFRWFYDVMDAVTLVALIGLLALVWVDRHDRERIMRIGLLALVILIGAAAVIAWTAQTYASQGRLLFPYVAASSPLLALGLAEVGRRLRFSPVMYSAPVALLAGFAAVVPFASIAPQYAPPPPLDSLPASASPVYARFGGVELVGYEAPDRRYAPGDDMPVTVYWRVIEQADRDLSLYLHAVLADGAVIGKVDSYPGAGRLRTTMWQPGAIYADTYAVPLDASAGASTLRLQVGWWHYPTQTAIGAVDAQGAPLAAVLLDAGGFVGETRLPQDIIALDPVIFGKAVALTGYTWAGDTLALIWECRAPLAGDYTVFAQVLSADNQVIGQGDAPPALPTRYWLPGDRFATQHLLRYPETPLPGRYRLVIGWYKPDDFTRLDAEAPDDAWPLLEIVLP